MNKQDYIKDLFESNNLDILVVVETWLREEISDNFMLVENYTMARQDRASRTVNNMQKRGGGICIYIRNTIPFDIITENELNINTHDVEMLTITLSIPNLRQVLITAVYRPPAGSIVLFNPIDPNPAISARAVFPQSGHVRPEKRPFFQRFPHFSKIEPQKKYKPLIGFQYIILKPTKSAI